MHIGRSYRTETYVHLQATQSDLHTMLYIYMLFTQHCTYLRHIANTVTTKRATITAIVEITAIVTLLMDPANHRKWRMSANFRVDQIIILRGLQSYSTINYDCII